MVLAGCGNNNNNAANNSASASTNTPAQTEATAEPEASGSDFPNKQIQIFVPFSAGGATDLSVRALEPKLESILGQTVEVVDKPGGAGALSMNEVLKSKPDGYTIGIVTVGPGIITPLTSDVGYSAQDFEAIAGYMDNPYVLAVSASSPYNSLEDLVNDIKAKPNKIRFGTTGPSSPSFIGLQQFQAADQLSFQLVPYNGGVDTVNALLGNNLDVIINVDSEVQTYVKDGKFKVLAVVTKKRSALFPDVQTADEQNVPALTFAPPPGGFFAPKGTPADVIAKLEAAIKEATVDADVKKSFDNIFIEPIFTSAADFRSAYDAASDYYKENLKQ